MIYNRTNRRERVKRNIVSSNSFTLIELITAMAVFSVIMLVMVRILGSAQEAWLKSEERNEIYETAQLAFTHIVTQLQSAQYKDGTYPFWHYRTIDNPPTSIGNLGGFDPSDPETFKIAHSTDPQDSNDWMLLGDDSNLRGVYDLLMFVTISNAGNDAGLSDEIEAGIFAWHDFRNNPRFHPDMRKTRGEDGWIRLITTSAKLIDEKLSAHYNFNNNFKVGNKTRFATAAFTMLGSGNPDGSKTDYASTDKWMRYLGNVTGLEFTCYREDGFVIPPDVTTTPEDISSTEESDYDAPGVGGHDCRDLNHDGTVNCWKDGGAVCLSTDKFADGRRAFDEHRDYFPAYVKVKLSLMGASAYRHWIQLAGSKVTPYNEDPNSESYKYRMKHQRTFTRVVVIRSKLGK